MMPTSILLDLAPFITPVFIHTLGEDVYERFQNEPDTLAIAVLNDDGSAVGLIERNSFFLQMASHYGRALYAKRTVELLMNQTPVVVDGDVTISEFCGRMLAERPSDLLHGFIVTCGGRYAGVGSALSLLQSTAAANAAHAEEMTRMAEVASRATLEARAALSAKSQFLAVMSHEIRTPLNGVLAVAEIVQHKLAQPELKPFLETIIDCGGTLLRLLNDALDLSRSELGRLELDEEPFLVAGLAEDVMALWRPNADSKGLSLAVSYDGPAEAWALGDRIRLKQVLNNLVGNALKFTDCGGVEVRIAAELEAGCLRLSGTVIDTGPGVPGDRLESIFAPFSQTEEGLKQGGAGLGLAVCRQLVEQMGGSIGAQNNPGAGMTFSFSTHLYSVQAPSDAVDAGHEDSPTVGLHCLIADDNATNRLVAQSLCEMFGCSAECVEDGVEAVAAAASGRFDLILMDIKMPRLDGVGATEQIRALGGAAARTPILALTANADPADAASYRAKGMDGVVEKPIKPERLLAAINALFEAEDDVLAGEEAA
jgi:signal transduction histidine kinase/ActR/RegA family two-component response regulator